MAPTMAIATTSVPLRAQSRERRPAVLGSFGGLPRRVRFTAVAAATAVAASSAARSRVAGDSENVEREATGGGTADSRFANPAAEV